MVYIEPVGLTMGNFDDHFIRSFFFLNICKSYQSQEHELCDREILAQKKYHKKNVFMQICCM